MTAIPSRLAPAAAPSRRRVPAISPNSRRSGATSSIWKGTSVRISLRMPNASELTPWVRVESNRLTGVNDFAPPLPLIADCLKAGKVIPFLGAGASFSGGPNGLPTAAALAADLASKTRFPPQEPEALATVAQWCQVVGGRQLLEDELHEVFAAAYAPARLHRHLAALDVPL